MADTNARLTDKQISSLIWKHSHFISPGNYDLTRFDSIEDVVSFARDVLASEQAASQPVAYYCPNDPDAASAFTWARKGVNHSGFSCGFCGQKHAALYTRPASVPAIAGAPDCALELFTEWFVKNYPGPDTIIHDPKWHAPRIFRTLKSLLTIAVPVSKECQPTNDGKDAAIAKFFRDHLVNHGTDGSVPGNLYMLAMRFTVLANSEDEAIDKIIGAAMSDKGGGA